MFDIKCPLKVSSPSPSGNLCRLDMYKVAQKSKPVQLSLNCTITRQRG